LGNRTCLTLINNGGIMGKVKTMVAMGALLMGVVHAQTSDYGILKATVQDLIVVKMTDGTKASKDDANAILQNAAVVANSASSPLELEFTVLTNVQKWDLTLSTANGGRLLNGTTPLKTNVVPDGSLGNGGSLFVSLTSYTHANGAGELDNVTAGAGADVDVSKGPVKLANTAFEEDEFKSKGLVESIFKVKAGLSGTTIIAPPGVYTETVTLTFVNNTEESPSQTD